MTVIFDDADDLVDAAAAAASKWQGDFAPAALNPPATKPFPKHQRLIDCVLLSVAATLSTSSLTNTGGDGGGGGGGAASRARG